MSLSPTVMSEPSCSLAVFLIQSWTATVSTRDRVSALTQSMPPSLATAVTVTWSGGLCWGTTTNVGEPESTKQIELGSFQVAQRLLRTRSSSELRNLRSPSHELYGGGSPGPRTAVKP